MRTQKTFFIDPGSGRKISVGSILVLLADKTIGIVRDMDTKEGVLQATFQQPCGAYSTRALEYDLAHDYISVMDPRDEKLLKDFLKNLPFVDRPLF